MSATPDPNNPVASANPTNPADSAGTGSPSGSAGPSSSSTTGPPPAGYAPRNAAGYAPGYGAAGFDQRAWKAQAKAQERLAREQMRMQRDQFRAQTRAARRNSIVGPLFLLGLGTVFLLLQTGHLSWSRALVWYGHWWPLLLIGVGVLMLGEWALNGRRGALLGSGTVFLLILLGSIGWTAGVAHGHMNWDGENFGGWTPYLGEAREEEGAPVSSAIAEGGTLQIHVPHGDVNVTGASDDGLVHVTVHKEIHGFGDSEVSSRSRALQPTFSGTTGALELSVPSVDGSHADLQVTVPRGTILTVDAERGAITVAEMHAAVAVSAGQGEVSLSGITGPVTAHLHNRNGSFSAHSVTGGVTIDGRGGDMNLSDVAGPVAMQGEFFGTTHMERVNGSVSFQTFRTALSMARLDGELEISSGSSDAPLQANAVMGPVVLHTSDRVITLDRVQGGMDISNRNGAVSVTSVGPLAVVSVHNRNGSVDVALPPGAGFTVNAQTHDGSINNDFGLTAGSSGEDRPTLTGTVGHGGPAVTVDTNDGDVTVRKGSGEPLPAVALSEPALSAGPAQAAAPGAAGTTLTSNKGTRKKP